MLYSFDILKTSNKNFQYVILNTDFISLDNKLFQIEEYLKSNHFCGKIIFNSFSTTKDFTKMNTSMYFDGDHFKLSSIKPENKIDSNTKSLINRNLKKYNFFR